METKFKQPGILSRLSCLLFGHKLLYDGAIKARPTPTLTNFIYKEDADSQTSVGLCFCPRCYTFTGLHFTQKKEKLSIQEEVISKAKKTKQKVKSKETIKKFKK